MNLPNLANTLAPIAKQVVSQSPEHAANIVEYMRVLTAAARREFTEDSPLGLDNFLRECLEKALQKKRKTI